MTKLFDGGILPLALGGGLFLAMTSWAQGRKILAKVTSQHRVLPEAFIQSLGERPKPRTPGVAIFLSSEADSIPHALLHNLKHNKSLHERIVILRFEGEDVPHVRYDQRLTIEDLGAGFTRLTVRHGFMDDPNVPQVLRLAAAQGLQLGDAPVSFSSATENSSRPHAARSVAGGRRFHCAVANGREPGGLLRRSGQSVRRIGHADRNLTLSLSLRARL